LKINLCSDIHTEFWQKERDYYHPGTGDVLVLAGDIGIAGDLADEESMFQRFLRDCVAGYNKVYMVLGNHSYYNFDFLKAEQQHRDLMPEGITLLQNQSEYYNGVHFIGATLWADFNNGNPAMMREAGECMNDYHCITHGDRMLTPADTLHEHDETITWFNQCLPMLRGKKVLITHHCVTHQSLSGRYAGSMSSAYATDLTRLLEQYSPDMALHGHCHESANYKVGNTLVACNPRGYSPEAINKNFNPSLELEIDV